MGNAESQGAGAGDPQNADAQSQPRTPARVPEQRVNNFIRYPQEVKDRALLLVDQNVPYRQIAAKVGPHCSTATIARWKKERDTEQKLKENMQNYKGYLVDVDLDEARRNAEEMRARNQFAFM